MSEYRPVGKLPNALLIGVQKAGTTSLFDWIAQHPQVYSNLGVKDYPFFWYDGTYQKGVEGIAQWFREAKGQPVLLAGNVNDIFFNTVPQRIFALNPDMRLIVSLRNPIERAYSAYVYAVERGLETRTFSEAIRQEMNNINYEDVVEQSQKCYLAHGMYWSQIERYLTYFNRSQIHVVLFEDIRDDRLKVIRDIYKFLRIDENFIPEFRKKNETKGEARFSQLNKILFNYALHPPWWYQFALRLIPAQTRYKIRGMIGTLNRKKTNIPPLDTEAIQILSGYFRREVEQTSMFVGRDLKLWQRQK